jgi:hypothetical protein
LAIAAVAWYVAFGDPAHFFARRAPTSGPVEVGVEYRVTFICAFPTFRLIYAANALRLRCRVVPALVVHRQQAEGFLTQTGVEGGWPCPERCSSSTLFRARAALARRRPMARRESSLAGRRASEVQTVGRRIGAALAGVLASLLIASSALGFECVNASKKNQSAGAQLVFGTGGQILYMTPGLASRIERGIVNGDTGEGFHGLVAVDFDGDGVADVSTWLGVGPDGEIPLNAQLRGPACRGLTNIGLYLTQCVGS